MLPYRGFPTRMVYLDCISLKRVHYSGRKPSIDIIICVRCESPPISRAAHLASISAFAVDLFHLKGRHTLLQLLLLWIFSISKGGTHCFSCFRCGSLPISKGGTYCFSCFRCGSLLISKGGTHCFNCFRCGSFPISKGGTHCFNCFRYGSFPISKGGTHYFYICFRCGSLPTSRAAHIASISAFAVDLFPPLGRHTLLLYLLSLWISSHLEGGTPCFYICFCCGSLPTSSHGNHLKLVLQ